MNKLLIFTYIFILSIISFNCNNCPEEVPFCEKEKEDNTTSALWMLALTGQASSSSSSEEATIEITGTAKDSNENVISNGSISVSESSSSSIQSRTTVTTSTITDSSGNFTLYLKVGKFKITVKKSDGTEIGSFELDIQNITEQHILPTNMSGLSIILNSAIYIGNNTDLLGIYCAGSKNSHEWGTFCDNKDGTITLYGKSGTWGGHTYTAKTLHFAKCSYGQVYNESTNDCTGTGYGSKYGAIQVKYCSTSDNSCDDGNTLNGSGISGAWDACNNYSLGGKSWRVTTIHELKLLFNCTFGDKELPDRLTSCYGKVNSLFTQNQGQYWSSTSYSSGNAYWVSFWYGEANVAALIKNDTASYSAGYVRCVAE